MGIKNTAIAVAATIPPITPVPIECRLFADAPTAIAKGTQPKIKAKDVMIIGRKRSLAAESVASIIDCPDSRLSTANSKIKIAFLAASAINMVRPIWK